VGLFTIEIVKKIEFQKSKMATDRPIITKGGMMIKNGSLNHSHRKKIDFKNSRWRMAAILETVRSPYLCSRLSDFDEIWRADAEQVN